MKLPKTECKVCKYVWNVLIAFDQFCNALLAGDPDETISSRLGKWAAKYEHTPDNWRYRVAKSVCFLLHLIDKNHCEESVEKDEGQNKTIE